MVHENRKLVEWLQPLVDALLTCSSFKKAIKMGELDSSASTFSVLSNKFNNCDRFALYIPYATETLTWHFLFSKSNRLRPPLIGFNDNNFKPSFHKINALMHWDVERQDCLKQLITELLNLYKAYQLSLCNMQERLKFELENLEQAQYFQNMEVVRIRRTNSSLYDTVFVFKLVIDEVKDLPHVYITDCIVDNTAVVIVKYKYSCDSAAAELKLSDFLSNLFTGKNALKLPSFSCLLSEYVESIREMIVNAVYAIGECFKIRKNFISRCIEVFKYLIDGDFIYWTRAAFLIDSNDFLYILHVKFTNMSSLNPIIDLQCVSIYHEMKASDTPYAERMTWKCKQPAAPNEEINIEELVNTLVAHVEEFGPKFKKTSCQNGV